MPSIFDNIERRLRPAPAGTMGVAHRADFRVGSFDLRGWRSIDAHVTALADVALLPVTNAAVELPEALVRGGAVPEKAENDAMHMAVAAVHAGVVGQCPPDGPEAVPVAADDPAACLAMRS